MRSLVVLFGVAALAVATLSSCSVFTADDMHQRGGNSPFLRGDTSQYRAVDNAIYDTLAERFGKDAVRLGEAPEKEYHHWFVRTPIKAVGLDEQRDLITGQPVRDPATDEYTVNIVVRTMHRMQDHGGVRPVTEFGKNRWIAGTNNAKAQANIANDVQAKIDAWDANGRPNVGNRRDEYLAKRERAGGGN